MRWQYLVLSMRFWLMVSKVLFCAVALLRRVERLTDACLKLSERTNKKAAATMARIDAVICGDG